MPATWGTGSRSSPIALDDSEEEVIQELTLNQFYGESPPIPTSHPPQVEQPITRSRVTPDSVFSALSVRKRKRQEDDASQVAGPSTRSITPQTKKLENRLSQSEAKRTRKRRKTQQRQAVEQQRNKPLNWLNNPHLLPVATGLPHPDEPLLHARMNEHEHVFGYDQTEGSEEGLYLDYGYSDNFGDEALFASSFGSVPLPPPPSSSWVSSMTMASVGGPAPHTDEEFQIHSPFSIHSTTPPATPSPPPPPFPPFLPPRPTLPVVPPLTLRDDDLLMSSSLRHRTPPPRLPPPIPPPPFSTLAPRLPRAEKSQPKSSFLQIGQAPDTDPRRKHGTFQVNPSALQPNIKASPKLPQAYTPNPARTLVMEELPKLHRTMSFVGKWARDACGGVAPKFIMVDTHSSKALVEFATADAARNAFASPRLGQELRMVKQTSLLKGKPRSDLIKVWWYRVAGIGAEADVREIEEGEIEDDLDGPGLTPHKEEQLPAVEEAEAGEVPFESQAQLQKETKKLRKVRLAQAREQKRVDDMQARMRAEQPSQMNPIGHPLPTLPMDPIHSTVVASSSSSLPPPRPPQDFHLPPLSRELPAPLPSFLPSTTPYPFDLSYPSPSPSTFGSQDWPPLNPTLPASSQSIIRGRQRRAAPPYAVPTSSFSSPGTSRLEGGNDILSANKEIPMLPSIDLVHSPPDTYRVISTLTAGQNDELADYEDVQMDVKESVTRERREAGSTSKDVQVSLKTDTSVPNPRFPPLHHSLPPRPLPMRPPSLPSRGQGALKSKKKAEQVHPTDSTKIQRTQSVASTSRDPSSPLMVDIAPLPSQADAFKAASNQAKVPLSAPSPLPPSATLPIAQTPDAFSPILPSTVPEIPQALPSLPVDPSVSDALAKQTLLLKEKILHEKITRTRLDPTAPSFKITEPSTDVSCAASITAQSTAPDVNMGRPSTPSSQAMEDSLRMMVLATKKAKVIPPSARREDVLEETKISSSLANTTSIGLPTPPPTASLPTAASTRRATSPPPLAAPRAPPAPSSVVELSLEDLAVSFITQTIETFKNNPPPPSRSSIDSNLLSTIGTPPPASPHATTFMTKATVQVTPLASPILPSVNVSMTPPPVLSISVASQLKAELASKQKRIEDHIQDSKSLMEKISKSRIKPEKDLLMKILREKTRLFEEENKASERKISKISASTSQTEATTNTKTIRQLQRWPTTQQDGVLILSDSEDDDEME